MLLPTPILCPKEIYDLMLECWNWSEGNRPTFKEIHMFIARKNLGNYSVEVDDDVNRRLYILNSCFFFLVIIRLRSEQQLKGKILVLENSIQDNFLVCTYNYTKTSS